MSIILKVGIFGISMPDIPTKDRQKDHVNMENSSKITEFIKVRKIKPSQIGQKCPVCSGFGTLKYGKIKCHGCDGKGFILVPAEEVEEVRQ